MKETMQSVFEQWHCEIDEETQRQAGEFEVRDNLGLMDRQDEFDCFQLEEQGLVDDEVGPKSCFKPQAMVVHRHWDLSPDG